MADEQRKPTIIESATVKVMRSHDYNHFETSLCLKNEHGVTLQEIDNHRKMCAQLVDKAIQQYEMARQSEIKKASIETARERLEAEVEAISSKRPKDRTSIEKGKLAAYDQINNLMYRCSYDYDDEFTFPDDKEMDEFISKAYGHSPDDDSDDDAERF